LGPRVEIKHLNSFTALEKAVAFEIQRQTRLLEQGNAIQQETLGWDEESEVTFSQRGKEEAHDYRYFPEPDLPPLVIEQAWLDAIRSGLPELPQAKTKRFQDQYGLNLYDTNLLIEDQDTASYFETLLSASPGLQPKTAANWMLGDLFSLMNQSGKHISDVLVTPQEFGKLLQLVKQGNINNTTTKTVLAEMFSSGNSAASIIKEHGFEQISDEQQISQMVRHILELYPDEVKSYLAGKEAVSQWLFGQVMQLAKGQANPHLVQAELGRQLKALRD
jgi:aspartyl-tRNA(Asn)/glutamyl-tRNA(Gln) amidotransferase subunit B